MMHVDIRALAKLARLSVTDEEVAKLEREIPSILGFVEAIQGVDASATAQGAALRNVMRADGDAHESGAYTQELLAAAPAHKEGRIVVKQVVSRKT